MKLRGYQQRAAELTVASLLTHKRVVLVMPSGSGKTVTAAAIVKRGGFKRAIWLAHRIELLQQAKEHLLNAGVANDRIGMLTGPHKYNCDADILIASISSMQRREYFSDHDLIVVDEAHRVRADGYSQVLAKNPHAMVLGLTATPWRLDGKSLRDAFDDMIVPVSQTELILGKDIARPVAYGISKEKALSLVEGVRIERSGDYSRKNLARRLMRKTLMGEVVSEVERIADGEATIVFAANREHGRSLAGRFKNRGKSVRYLDANTPTKEREDILGELANGTVKIVVNVDVLIEGFDCPPVKCIVMARPTASLTRFLQQCGRAVRPYKNKRPIIIDHAGNCWRFGLPDEDREWSLDQRPKTISLNGCAPIRICEECDAAIPAASTECPECGARQPTAEHLLKEYDVKLERLEADRLEMDRKLEILRGLAAIKGLGESWVQSTAELFR